MNFKLSSPSTLKRFLTPIVGAFALAIPSLCYSYYQFQLPLPEQQARTIPEVFSLGHAELNFRARFEYVDDESFEALLLPPRYIGRATTLSSSITYQTAPFCGLFGVMDFNNVTSYFNNRHNSGNETTPFKTDYAEIPDPKGTALDEVYLAYQRLPDTTIIVGRQKMNLDNQRFVGSSDFRQMPQTFDAVAIVNNSLLNVELFYGFISQVNSIWQGNERALFQQRANTTHLINMSSRLFPFGNVIGYGYLIDDEDIGYNSTNTFGLRYLGTSDYFNARLSLYLEAEYAHQNGTHNNPANFHANYFHLDGGLSVFNVDLGSGLEVLTGSNSRIGKAFRTPLASRHIFNGLADKFVITPDAGLVDIYSYAGFHFWEVVFLGQYHFFKAESGDDTYGNELDLSISRPILDRYSIGLEFADFKGKAENGFADTTKYWVTATASFG